MPSTTFEEAAAVTQLTSHTYAANFSEEWCIGTVPHGGFITTVFLRAAHAHFSSTLSSQNQPHPITLHLDFLRRTHAGPALFTITDVKLGRQTSIIHISLVQDHHTKAIASITHSNTLSETGISLPTGYALVPAPPAVNHALLATDSDPAWHTPATLPFADFRKAQAQAEFFYPRAGQPHGGRIGDEWVRLRGGQRWTTSTLGYIADMWPLPLEALAGNGGKKVRKYWYPTVVLNLDIKKPLPEEGVEWLFARVETKVIRNGRMDLDVVILDQGGNIVALSHHVALAVSVERNVAERKTGAKI